MIFAFTLLLAGIVFGRSLNGAFSREDSIFDDPALLDQEPWFDRRHHPFWKQVRDFHRSPRVITMLSYKWTWFFFGYSPIAWHAGNLALHLANIALVYRLVSIPWPAGAQAVAALFAVCPLGVSAVCYIAGRAAVLATFFTLCGLALFIAGGWSLWLCPLALYLAAKSKQDAPVYWLLFPAFWLWCRLT
jgi:hypothetical protein